MERRQEQLRKEQQETDEAFELLELRSLGVRSALNANLEANQRVAAGEWKAGQSALADTSLQQRAEQLHKKLGIDQVKLVTR